MMNNKGEFTLNVYSSLEGHALILISGNNLMNLKDYELSCFFQPFPNLANANSLKSYKSIILKDKTSCPVNDYNCIYWTTSYQFTNQQIGCYTPRIPEVDRLLFANTIDYYVSLVFGENIKISCSDINKCKVRFGIYNTPIINFIDSSNFYAGFPITFRLKPNINKIDQLINIKIARYNCLPNLGENFADNNSDIIISCDTGDFQTDITNQFQLNYMYGLATAPFNLRKFVFSSTDLNQEIPYYFKIFPKIDSININNGFLTGGTELIIAGKGFKIDDVKVFIDDSECKNLKNISSISVTCTTENLTLNSQKTLFFGSNGLRVKRFDLSGNVSFNSLNSIITAGTAKPIYDDIILEASTKPNIGINYGQFINGFFKAPFDAKYRFWSTSDDENQIYLTFLNESKVMTRTKIIDFSDWNYFDDFISRNDQTRSNWISLNAGQFYPLEIYHLQGRGADHFRVGVEISEYNKDSNLEVIPNQANPIQNISFNVKYQRDLYEIPIETLDPNAVIKVGCMSGTPVDIKISDSPIQFLNKIKTLEEGASSFPFIIRKYAVNENKEYLVNASETSSDYSYSGLLSFDKMYINLNSDPSKAKQDLNIKSTGTKNGYSFLFFIDRKKSDRTFRWENSCYYITPGTTTKKSIIIKQYVSNEVTGTLALILKDNLNNKEYKTNFLDINTEIYKLPSEINNFPFLMNNFQLIWKSTGEFISFFIRYPNRVNIENVVYPFKNLNLNLSFDTSKLTGGYDNTYETVINNIIAQDSKNLFFFPITPDFLYTKNIKPQVRIVSNGNEAVCFTEICSFNYIDSTTYSTVINAVLNNNLINVTLDKVLVPEIKIVRIYLGDNYCIVTNIDKINLSCQLDKIIVGNYPPIVKTELGNLNISGDNITVNMSISSISPMNGSSNGGTNVIIEGSYFPINITSDLSVLISSIPCSVTNITNTKITCITGLKSGSDFSDKTIKIIYKTFSTEKVNAFTYTQGTTIPILQSISQAYLAPGDKKTLKLDFDSLTNIDKNQVIVSLDHKTDLGYSIKMNVLSINGNSLLVRFGGAKIGEYNVNVVFNGFGLSKSTSNLTLKTGIEINSVSPLFGSSEGGTEITITGKNFLLTQVNQNIFFGRTQCLYKKGETITDTTIKCITQKPNQSTSIDQNLPVVIDQMIQYSSICIPTTLADKCQFIYDSSKTCKITRLETAQSNNQLIFGLNDAIIITGSNFILDNSITKLIFIWGEVTIDSKTLNSINGKISKINNDNYGINNFFMYNSHGLCTQAPEFPYESYSNIMIFLRKPEISITKILPLISGQYGTILRIYTPVTDFKSNNLNSVKVCDQICEIMKNNLITDSESENHFQCMIKKALIFSECKKLSVIYYGINKDFDNFTFIANTDKNYSFVNIRNTNNIDIINVNFKIMTPDNFSLKIILASGKTDFQNLKILIDNRYEFIATSPGSLNSSNQAEYLVNFPNGLPAGQYSASIYEDTIGYLLPSSILGIKDLNGILTVDFKISIPLILDPIQNLLSLNASFNGGLINQITGKNFNSLITDIDTSLDIASSNSFQKVIVCGFPSKIVDSKSNYIKFSVPQIFNNNDPDFISKLPTFNDFVNNNFHSYMIEYSNVDLTTSNLPLISDDNSYSYIKTTLNGYVGIKIKEAYKNTNFKIYLGQIQIFIGDLAIAGDFDNGVIEGSMDGISWTKIMDLPKSLPFMWYTINITYPQNITTNLFKYIRLKPNVISYISELRFLGHVILDSGASSSYKCDVKVVDNFNERVVDNLEVIYNNSNTVTLSSIIPYFTSSKGEENVVFTFSNNVNFIQSDLDKIIIKIYSNQISKDRISITTPSTLTIKMIPKDLNIYDRSKKLEIYIERLGNVDCLNLYFQYLDRWSSTDTWGGEFIPINGETAYVTNADVLVDINFDLNTLVIENGSIVFEDGIRDYNLSAKNILVKNGEFNIGKENAPFQKQFTLTLKGDNKDPALPIFGNKVLAVMEGTLQIFGKEKTPSYALLNKTVKKGENQIKLNTAINWEINDEIVIASSSHIANEAERRKIISIDRTNSNEPIITIDTSLNFDHYGEIETYTLNEINDVFDMRAEIINLTRNVVIQGDESSTQNLYGVHIMLASMKMGLKSTMGKISNLEVRRAGQAFQLGRYPIHFHMIGDVPGSYVKNCAIHDTFNRGLTIHAVNEFVVENNVAFNVMGHTFFIEDAVETNNIIRNNVGILTRASFSLLNTDCTPATFWITNPSNFIEKNRAAGSEAYGFWMDFPVSATGLNAGLSNFCPRGMPLGSFKDNVSHSNGKYGMRVFPEYNPKNKPCGTVDDINVLTSPAIFENLLTYRNREKGFITERIGNCMFKGFKSAENPSSCLEISDLIRFNSGSASIINAAILGSTKNPVSQSGLNFETLGLITPRNDNLLVDTIRFYNFSNTNMAPFSSCSRCEVSSASTDSDARTIFFKNIKYDSSVVKKIRWAQPRRAIFRDLDGTLTGIGNSGGWVTPYYPHLLTKECKRDATWDDAIICDNTVQIRRVSLYELNPSTINGQDLKILNIPKLVPLDPLLLTDLTKYSNIKYKEKKDPSNAWTTAFITGYNYVLTFGLGLNFDSLSIIRSNMWESLDKPINLLFNYSYRRDDFSILGYDNSTNSYKIDQINDISIFENPGLKQSISDNLSYGAFKNYIEKNYLALRINSLNPKFYSNLKLSVTAIQCKNNDCGSQPPTNNVQENFIRKWSDPTNWPNNKIPNDGDDVEIKSGWQMVLDVSTKNLNQLTINGYLVFNNTVDDLSLNANIILIKDGRLEIGNKDNPYKKKATINLLGDKFSKNLLIDNTQQLTNKILANLNELLIFGENRGPYKTRLLSSVKPGDKKIYVEKNLKWLIGDEIIVSTSSYAHNETEKFTISNYDSSTGELILSKPLLYNHYGSIDSLPLPNNPTFPLINPDERTEVFMLTRNIKIKGSQDWGCNIISISSKTPNFVYNGKMNISNVEINYCGQTDTEFYALQFLNTNSLIPSIVTDVSFNYNNYAAVAVIKSSNIIFENNLIYGAKKFGFNIKDSSNIKIYNNTVSQLNNRVFPEQLKKNKIIDMNACFHVCQEGLSCNNVNLFDNVCAGSEFVGFIMESLDCTVDLKLNGFNTAYSCEIGFMITNLLKKKCIKGGNVVSMRNWGNGYATNPLAESSYHENIISIGDKTGISILSAADSKVIGTRKNADKIMILGQSLKNPMCIPINFCNPNNSPVCTQQGFVISVSSISEMNLPLNDMSLPLENPRGDASFGSFFDGNFFTFTKWEDQCIYTSTAIKTNIHASDMSSITNFKNVIFDRVLDENLIYFENPKPEWVGDPCGSFPCSGPNNVIIKFINFKDPVGQQDIGKLILNGKWSTSAVKKYVLPNKSIDGNSISDFIKEGVTLIPNKYTLPDCQIISSWNAQICSLRDLGLLLIQNTENEAETRTVAPIFIQSLEESFINKINSFMDHKCEQGYPSHLRTPIHAGIMTMNKRYNITFTGSNPSNMRIKMFDVNYPNGPLKNGIFTIKYGSPQTVVIFDNLGKEIKSREWKESENISITDTSLKCGDSKWTSVANTLDFFITNDVNCILTFKAVNSIQLSLRLNISVEDFYSKGSRNQLIFNIAAVLNIPPEQIRITGILKGSTIVQTQILEKVPTLNDSTSSSSSSTTNSNTGTNNLLVDGKLNLSRALDTLISSIQTGSLNLPAPVLDIKYNVVTATNSGTNSNNNVPSNNNNNTVNNNSTSISNSTQTPLNNTNNPSGSINITQPSNNIPINYNNGTSKNQTDVNNNNGHVNIIEDTGKRNLILILSICIPLFVILIIVIVVTIICLKKKKLKSEENNINIKIQNTKLNITNNLNSNDYQSNRIITLTKNDVSKLEFENNVNLNKNIEMNSIKKDLTTNNNNIIEENSDERLKKVDNNIV